ncbi:MAG TPA: hypothetical protein VF331_13370 [Polyangiales bacterium]
MLDDAKDAFRARMRDPFLFSFVASFCVVNWKPLLFLVGSKWDPSTRFDIVESAWGWSWGWPLLSAAVFSVGYPWLGGSILLARTVIRAYFETWTAKRVSRSELAATQLARNLADDKREIELRGRIAFDEVERHENYIGLSIRAQALEDHVREVWRFAPPSEQGFSVLLLPVIGSITPPCFIHLTDRGAAQRVGSLAERKDLRFAYALLGPQLVLAFPPNGNVPWPVTQHPDAVRLVAADRGRLRAADPSAPGPLPTAYLERVNPTEKWGRFEVTSP